MMYAILVVLYEDSVSPDFLNIPKSYVYVGTSDLVCSLALVDPDGRKSGKTRSGSTDNNPDRYRIYLKIEGDSEYDGTYYIGGYQDSGYTHLEWDPVQDYTLPNRRAAIAAMKSRKK